MNCYMGVVAILVLTECKDEDSHSQVSSYFGSWSPGGLPNFQRAIIDVKTPLIEDFFISLESFWQKLQLCFKPHTNRRFEHKVIVSQSCGSLNLSSFGGLPLGSPSTKSHSDVIFTKSRKKYYMGEGGGFPRVRAVVNLMSPRSPVVHPSTIGDPTMY
jgi:hypothetical protein